MRLLKTISFFLVINFGALALGSWLMNNGPLSNWYINLNKAPWTPPGWVFGITWSIIMICFSIYLGHLFTKSNSQKARLMFSIQLFLNIIWNYIFFNQHLIGLGLLTITLLTIVVFYFFINFEKQQNKRVLLLPYMVWLCIATSLNAYILLNN